MSDDQSETPDDGPDAPEPSDALTSAYAERTRQLHEARGALAEAVATLRAELIERRQEAAAKRQEAAALRRALDAAAHRNQDLETELKRMATELERQTELISTLRNMKVVRWTAGPRGVIYRLRGRLR